MGPILNDGKVQQLRGDGDVPNFGGAATRTQIGGALTCPQLGAAAGNEGKGANGMALNGTWIEGNDGQHGTELHGRRSGHGRAHGSLGNVGGIGNGGGIFTTGVNGGGGGS